MRGQSCAYFAVLLVVELTGFLVDNTSEKCLNILYNLPIYFSNRFQKGEAMPHERVKQYFVAAQTRLHNKMKGELPVVTQSAALGILDFAEQEAQQFGVSLPPGFHAFREDLQDPEKIQAIIEKGEREVNA